MPGACEPARPGSSATGVESDRTALRAASGGRRPSRDRPAAGRDRYGARRSPNTRVGTIDTNRWCVDSVHQPRARRGTRRPGRAATAHGDPAPKPGLRLARLQLQVALKESVPHGVAATAAACETVDLTCRGEAMKRLAGRARPHAEPLSALRLEVRHAARGQTGEEHRLAITAFDCIISDLLPTKRTRLLCFLHGVSQRAKSSNRSL